MTAHLHHRNCGIGTPTGCDCEYGFQLARRERDQAGFDPSRVFVDFVGAVIDMPSLYMGGPSRDARRKANDILRWLCTEGGRDALDAASVDTLPKGQDAKQGLAGTEGSAVTPKAGDAQ